MPQITANRPYGLLAKYYDQLCTLHVSWYEAARQRVLGGILPDLESACDLACGTGTTALMLARKGIKMYGVDLGCGTPRPQGAGNSTSDHCQVTLSLHMIDSIEFATLNWPLSML